MFSHLTDSQRIKKIISWLCSSFFVAMLLYHEILLHGFLYWDSYFSIRLLIIVLSAAASGLIITVILMLLPANRLVTWCAGIFVFFCCAFTSIEYCLKMFFGNYFSLAHAFQMAPEVLANYQNDITGVITARAGFIILSLIPLVIYIIFGKNIIRNIVLKRQHCLKVLIFGTVLQIAVIAAVFFSGKISSYTTEFTTDRAIETFGLCTDAQLEVSYSITGVPSESFDFSEQAVVEEKINYNVSELDFSKMAETETDETIKNLDLYFNSVSPSPQNEYTGMFKDKNLILITAESFCPYMISETLTPALYRLTHEGFVAEDFYQPMWAQSTTGGEYALMTGMIPTWIDDNYTFYETIGKSMPYSPGWQFRARGYTTVAYHNGDFDFYDRNLTHPNMGYDFSAKGGTGYADGTVLETGLTFSTPSFPSDVEMFQQTMPALIQNYTENGQRFHAYYMTISGHGVYTWNHGTAQKNQQVILENYPGLSETSQSYLAANMELEYALEYLLASLEAAGIAQDTVIVMTGDHYPYFMVTDEADYYNELRGFSDSEADISRYKNSLVLWCGSMTESVSITTPCNSTDVLPTLYNLFGIDYDSRLLSGRDLLAEDLNPGTAYNGMPVAVIPTTSGTSWKTTAGTYDSSTGVFTPNEGVTVDENYVETVNQIVKAKYTYAGTVIQTNYFQICMNALAAQTAEKAAAQETEQQQSAK